MTAPHVEPIGDRRTLERLPGGGFAYVLIDEVVRIEFRQLRREHGVLNAEVEVVCPWAVKARRNEGSISCADLNLSSISARNTLAKYCAGRAQTKPDQFDWTGAIHDACIAVNRTAREYVPSIVLADAPFPSQRTINISGLPVPLDGPSMFIAHGDSLKSMLALWVAGTMAQQEMPVLYCDFEWTADQHNARRDRLFGERLDLLRHLDCRGSTLRLHADWIRRECDLHHIQFLVIDSVSQACEGKLVDDDAVRAFSALLATLPPSLSTAHVAKSTLGPDGKDAGAYGSVMFHDLWRKAWIVKKQETEDRNVYHIGLFESKHNATGKTQPVGLTATFGPTHIDIVTTELAGIDGLADKLSVPDRLAHLLKSTLPLTYAEASTLLDVKVGFITQAVHRNPQRFVKIDKAGEPLRFHLREMRAVEGTH